MAFSTPHTRDTQNPQSYWQHFANAFCGSLMLIVYGLAGLVHALMPEVLQFYTSTGIIRSYRALELSRRHDAEIAREFSAERLSYVKKHRGK